MQAIGIEKGKPFNPDANWIGTARSGWFPIFYGPEAPFSDDTWTLENIAAA